MGAEMTSHGAETGMWRRVIGYGVLLAAGKLALQGLPTIFHANVEAITLSMRNAAPQVRQVENAKSA